jgi:RimJ/RimL family protein N-acetyltransferase
MLRPLPWGVQDYWQRLLEGITPMPEAAFGPECRDPRPRIRDTYYCVVMPGAEVGLAYTQRPAPSTVIFALGLFREHQGRGLGPQLRDLVLAHCFADRNVHKVETEIYSSNTHSLGALHERHGRMQIEGVQRETIIIGTKPYDRVLLGITRNQWEQTKT